MKSIPIVPLLSLLILTVVMTGAVPAQELATNRTANLTPANPYDDPLPWSFDLDPQQMARYTVNIAQQGTVNGTNYTLRHHGYKTEPVYSSGLLWAWKRESGGSPYIFNVVNTLWQQTNAWVTVTCRWGQVTSPGGGGGGPGDPPGVIDGKAQGLARHQIGHFAVSNELAIFDPFDYLCINETVELTSWVVRPENYPFNWMYPVDSDWSVTPAATDGGNGTVVPAFGQSVVFTPTLQGEVTVTATAPLGTGPLTANITFGIIRIEIAPTNMLVCWKMSNTVELYLTNSYWGSNGVHWTGTNGLNVTSAAEDHLRFTPSNSTPQQYAIRATSQDLTNCWDEAIVEIIKILVEPPETNVCWQSTNLVLNLSSDSFWNGGTVNWTQSPDGMAGVGSGLTNFWFSPNGSTPTAYVVRATSSLLPDCWSETAVNVYRVEISPPSTNVCWNGSDPVTLSLVNSFWGANGIEWSGTNGLDITETDNAYIKFVPADSTPSNYTIRATIADLTNCWAEATVNVIEVEYEIGDICAEGVHTNHNVSVVVTGNPTDSTITFELKRIAGSTGAAVFTNNNSSVFTITGSTSDTVLTVLGTAASDAVSNMVMEARLGSSVCGSNRFTVVDLVSLTGTEGLHPVNTVTDATQDGDVDPGNTVWICQTTNDTATLELDLSWLPTGYPGEKFRWDAILTSGTAATEWGGPGDFADNPTNIVWSAGTGAQTNREFHIRTWFDCDGSGTLTNTVPNRIIGVTVVDFTRLMLSNNVGTNFVVDITREDEPASVTNTLYLAEGTNGTAEMTIQGWWAPESVTNTRVRWEIVLTNETANPPEWDVSSSPFVTNPVTVTWNVANAAGFTNREFIVRGWYDCDQSGEYDSALPHRELFVSIVDFTQLMLSNNVGANFVVDITPEDEPVSVTNTLYLAEGTNGTAEMTIQGWWAPESITNTRMRWETVLTNETANPPEWDVSSSLFVTNPVTVTWSATNAVAGVTNREFIVRGWYDCDESGEYDSALPHRELFVSIVDFSKLMLSNNVGTNFVVDITPEDESASVTNTLYLAEGTNGTAEMTVQGWWEPPNVESNRFRWQIVETDGAAATQWTPADGTFGEESIVTTWSAGGSTNQEFIVRGWYDCDASGDYDPALPHRELFVTIVTVDSIVVTPSNWPGDQTLPDPVWIGAGGLDSAAHKAGVVITVSPPVAGVPIEVRIERGIGHDNTARLEKGDLTAWGGGEAVEFMTGTNGLIEGTLTSSDAFDTCTLHAGTKQTNVLFNWVTQFDPESDWLLQPNYLPVPGTLTNIVLFQHHRGPATNAPAVPFDQHEIRFFVESVEWIDTNGVVQVITNTPTQPSSAVTNWAVFEDPTVTCAQGWVTNRLTVYDKPELYAVTLVAYDWSVWREPPAEPQPMGMMTLMSQTASDDRLSRAELDPRSKHTVWIEFMEDDATRYNFSPALGETASIKIRKHPEGVVQGYEFKMEIVRLLDNDGSQLVDQLDVEPGNPDYVTARGTDFNQLLLTWNGIPGDPGYVGSTENPSQAEGPDEFVGVNGNFKRMLPAITLGEPAPPPLYYARSVVYPTGFPNVEYHVAYHPIHVPQVVKLKYDADAMQLLRSVHVEQNDPNIILYNAFENEEWWAFTNSHLNGVQELFDNNVNIRIVGADTDVAGAYSTVTMAERYDDEDDEPEHWFGASQGDFPNTSPSSEAWVYVYAHRHHIQIMYNIHSGFEGFTLPITPDEIAKAFSAITAHEIGHSLGLVADNLVLDGSVGLWHNKAATAGPQYTIGLLMNPVGDQPTLTGWAMIQRIRRSDPNYRWLERNGNYLKFILPRKEEP